MPVDSARRDNIDDLPSCLPSTAMATHEKGEPAERAIPAKGGQQGQPVLEGGPEPEGVAPYLDGAFIARYAAVWAYGVADPDRTSEPYYRRVLEAAGRGLPAPRTVLDAGCGPGRIIADLAALFPASACTGIDSSPAMIQLARTIIHAPYGRSVLLDAGDFGFMPVHLPTRGRPDVLLINKSLAEHADGGDQHDLVVASHLLDRVPDPPAGVAALSRCVAPGGRLVVTCAFNFSHRQHWSIRTAEQLASAVEAHGLVVETLDDAVPYVERLDIRGTITTHRAALVTARRLQG